MFEKLFLLVKSNAAAAVINNPVIPASSREAVINEASSSIIEVLKAQLETGKIADLIKFFQFSGANNESLITSVINRFANKLNNYYNIDMASAQATAASLIPPVMRQLVLSSKNKQDAEFGLSNMLSKLNGNNGDLSSLVNTLKIA